ncbi:MAG TPA: efflux RND transporter permease subunit, partial [Tepidisphaeraceae bacterium]|nr:efflux RND transporter permease subunit [Tepidisphaeraceae bacterium]
MFSRFFIHRPVFACVISILIVLLGAVAYFRLPVDQYPDIAPPIVHVQASYPGANAQTIADTVAAPIEQSVNGVDRMIYMNSTSTDGNYALDVSFEPGTDVDMAAVLVQNRVNIAESKLPEEARRQGVSTSKQSTAFVAVLSLYSPDGSRDDLFLANYMARAVQDRIARVYGVGGSTIYPAKEYAMRVWLDPEKLKVRGLTVDDVGAAVREQNVQVAAGAIGRPPMPNGVDFEMTINTLGRFTTAEQFEQIIIKTSENGQSIVRLKDIAKVELGTRDYSTISRFNNQPSAILIVFQLPGANLTSVSAEVAAEFEKIKKEFPSGVDGKIFYDASMFIKSSMNEVITTLIEAFILVALVVLVFLQDWRTTLIPLITIPVSLIGTFLVMYMLGFSINMLTMFGIVLAIGIVVDDAIVVVENVERNRATTNLEVHEATDRAMR